MNKSKGPLFLTEHGVKKEVIDSENQVNEEVVAKITIEDVNNQIITTIQNILELDENLEHIDSLIDYLKLFGFDINQHISLDKEIINNDKISYKYAINEEGEKIIKSVLIYQESKRIIKQKLESGINFTGLNKKLNYINQNSNKNITVSDTYTKQELEKIQDIVKNTANNENLLLQIGDLITKIDNQEEYKSRLELINQVIISVNYDNISQDDLSNSLNYTNQNIENTFSLYKAILVEAKQLVKSNFDTISYSYTEENTESIENKKIEKNKKIAEQQEMTRQNFENKVKIEKEKNNKKILKRSVIAGVFGVLISGGIILDKEYGEANTKPVNELNGPNIKQYANKLYDELILKNKISDEKILSLYKEEFNNLIISFMNTVGTTESDINILKGLLGKGISITSIDNELEGKEILMNISNKGNDTLIVNIKINDTVIFDNVAYFRKPLYKSNSIDKNYEVEMYDLTIVKIKKYMKKSNTKDELVNYISNDISEIIRKVFKDYNQHFKAHIEYFGNKIFIKITNTHNNKEYNLSFELDRHLK